MRRPFLLLLLLSLAAGPAEAQPQGGEGPLLRIALGEPRPEVGVTSTAGMAVHTADAERTVPSPGVLHLQAFSRRAEDPAATRPLFRVMVASDPDEASVRRLGGWLAQWSDAVPVTVDYNEERSAWRAYAGAFVGRAEAAALVPRLVRHGLRAPWVTERTGEEGSLEAPPGSAVVHRVPGTGPEQVSPSVRIVPAPGSFLVVDGVRYRGELEVRPGPAGTLRVLNILAMEPYLRGVVPREMGPAQFPRSEALEAQAVAARTYAWRHRGLFEPLGFDLCDSPRCQAYGGASVEHPMSDRAVAATRGKILVHDGEPIKAYYTANCGGHTEDVGEVFVEEDAPYLRGVPCPTEAPEGLVLRRKEPVEVLRGPEGDPRNLPLALLVEGGLVPQEILRRELALGRPGPEWEAWTEAIEALLQEESGAGESAVREALLTSRGTMASRADLLAAAAQSLRATGRLALEEGRVVAVSPAGKRVRVEGERGRARLDLGGVRRLFERRGEGVHPVGALVVERGDLLLWSAGAEGSPGIVVSAERAEGATRVFPPRFRWSREKTAEELEARLHSRTGAVGVRALRPLRLTPSGRITEMEVVATFGSLLLRGIRVRWGLGLPENLLTWEEREAGFDGLGETIRFTGHGWGHGVGLCQVGSYGLARAGWDHERILRHYYRGALLETVY